MSDENYHSNEINTCLPLKLKSADNVHDREERLTTPNVKKPYTFVPTVRFMSSATTPSIITSHSVCTTVA